MNEAIDIPAQNQQLATTGPAPVVKILEAIIEKGVTAENIGAVEKMVDLYERMQNKEAEKAFAAAFVQLQADMPAIHADKPVPDKFGNVKYRFAPYESIMHQVKPLLQKHGFTVTFSCDFREGRVIQACTLMHVAGHSRTNSFAARIGSGPPGSSEAQGDGAASTYAKRFALCNALNIVTELDTDGRDDVRAEGELISPDKVMFLKEQVRETRSDERKFLEYAGVKTYEEIREGRYAELVRSLAKKRG